MEEGCPFLWVPMEKALFLSVFPEEMPFSITHRGTLCTSCGLGCRIPKMPGPCEGQPRGRGGGQWTYWLRSPVRVTDFPPRSPGRVHFQCCADDAAHHGQLCLPQVGPGRGLAHGSVFHGPHPRVYGLHVPHLKGLPEAGKSLLRSAWLVPFLHCAGNSLCPCGLTV